MAPAPRSPDTMRGPAASDFRGDAEAALADLGERLRRILAHLCPGEVSPRELERLLGLHKTLCWRVLKVAYAREPLSAVPHLPGGEGMDKFLASAAARGVDTASVAGVREALDRYRKLAKAHAGDRASFEVMLQSAAAPEESDASLRAARRAGYRSTSYVWGVQTAARVLTAIITPVGEELVDLATVRAHVRVRRVRKEGVLRLSRTVEHDTEAPGPRRVTALPIAPESVAGGVPLLPEFCSHPLPKLHAVELPDGNVEYQFSDQAIGERAAITVYVGEVRRGLRGARWRTQENPMNAIMLTVRDPIGLGVIDLWAPPGFGLAHRAVLVSAAGVDPLAHRPDQWRVLPVSAGVERMGRGLRAARLREAPEYENSLAYCFDRLGWNPESYELHRFSLEYPILGSCMVLQTDLPSLGGGDVEQAAGRD